MKDFFISYQQSDVDWAVWIDETLRGAGFSTVFQHRDFEYGSDFVAEIDEALTGSHCTIAVLSEAYLHSWWTQIERNSALARMQRGGRLIPVKVGPVADLGVLAAIPHVDLVGKPAPSAARALLEALGAGSATASATAPPVPAAAGARRVSNIPYLRNRFFVGRDEVLDALARHHEADAGATTIEALIGLGGVGKSQVAIEYAQRQTMRFGVRLWIDAHDEAALRRGFAAAARALGLRPGPRAELADLVAAVDEHLAERPGWLLVLDNVEDVETVLPCIPTANAGQVLVTTRLDDVAALGAAQPLQIAPLSLAESRAFVLRRTRREALDAADAAALDELVAALDGLPLALEQAAAYISQTGARFDAYLASLRRGQLELLERGKPATSPYAGTVGSTWRMNLECIATESPAASELLRLCAFLAPDPLPLEPLARAATTERFSLAGAIEQLVLAPEDWRHTHVLGTALRDALRNSEAEPLKLYELVAPLLRYSLVRMDASRDAIVVHRVLQDVIRAGLDAGDARLWAGRALEMVDLVFPREPSTGVGVSAEADALMPHALAAIANARRYSPEDGLFPAVLEIAGCYLLDHASPARAVPLLKECADLTRSRSGPDSEQLGVALHNLGRAYTELGRYDAAEDALRGALQIREAHAATNELSLAKTQNALGHLLALSGRATEAEPLHRRALGTFERVAGVDSELVAISCQFLGNCAAISGNWDAARALNRRSLAIFRKVLPPASFVLGTALYNLALSLPDPAEALHCLQEARGIYEAHMGADSLWVARADAAIAMQHRLLGNPSAAEPLLMQALAVFDRELPPNHPEIAGPLEVLAKVLIDLGRPGDAVAPLERAHAILALHAGETSLEALQALANLVQQLHASGQFERGVPVARAFVDAMAQAGQSAVSVAQAMSLYGSMLHGAKAYADAREVHRRALALLEAAPDAPPGLVAVTVNNIASTHHVQGHADEAEDDYRRALDLFARSAPDDPMRKVCARNLALLLRGAGRNDAAAMVEADSGIG